MKIITRLNEIIAVSLTRGFGSIWVFYLFVIYGLLPLLAMFHAYQETFLYWSNWVQLAALPLIMTGTNILGRDAELRAAVDHEKLTNTYEEQLLMYQDIIELMNEQRVVLAELQNLRCHPRNFVRDIPSNDASAI